MQPDTSKKLQIVQNNSHYDYIIAGAGASGLSLLWYLLHSGLRNRSILVIDNLFDKAPAKTWCFWDPENIPFKNVTRHSWNSLSVKGEGLAINEKLHNYRYCAIDSNSFSKHITEYASGFRNVEFRQEEILSIRCTGGKAEITTNAGTYSCGYAFQSVLKQGGYESSKSDISISQHFKGWVVETGLNQFDPETAVLMDFDTGTSHEFSFFYLLPLSGSRALIEYTLFSSMILQEHEYDAAIENYLSENFGINMDSCKIVRTEKGIIPMEDRRYPLFYNERTLNIGTAGGWTKPSTGYTFSRIQDRCRDITQQLEKGNRPVIRHESRYRFRVYDIMILFLMKHHPDESVRIFLQLFKTSGIEKILKFLNEETTFIEEVSIFSKLKYRPFFRSIYHMKHRIFTGA